MSKSLEGRISEEDFQEEAPVKKVNFTEKLYLSMVHGEEELHVPIVSIQQDEKDTIVEYSPPDDAALFKKSLNISRADNLSISLSSSLQNGADEILCDLSESKIKVTSVRQSLLGYNYLVTIVICDYTVF